MKAASFCAALTCAAFVFSAGCSGDSDAPVPHPSFSGGFERGFDGFNLAGVGEVEPTVVEVPPGTHRHAARFSLRGHEGRSEVIVGGDGGDGNEGTIEFGAGAERWLGFSFDILRMDYGPPRFFNLIMQLKGEGEGSPNLAIQLAEEDGRRGIWTSGEAMGGSRFLAPVAERRWHRIELDFRVSGHDAGFYRLFLDGRLIDRRRRVRLLPPGSRHAYVKLGIYRDGIDLDRQSTTLVDSVAIGDRRVDVRPDQR